MRPPISQTLGLGLNRLIAALASRQHGAVARWQLLELDVSAATIRRWVRGGRLHRIHPGVYLLGHRAIRRGTMEMAAVLACGPTAMVSRHGGGPLAVVSHHSAAGLHKLLPYPAKLATVCVTVAGGDRRSRKGIRVYRAALAPDEVTKLHQIPVTTPLRTLVDLAATIRPDRLEQVVALALREELLQVGELREAVEGLKGRRGAPALRRVLGLDGGPQYVRSEAERRMLALVRTHRLPPPAVNEKLGIYEIDFLWADHTLAVEVDGRQYHSDPLAFQRDRERSNELQLRGYTILRVTWADLVRRPELVAERIRRALSAAAGG